MIQLPQLFPNARRIHDRLYVTICPFHEDDHASLRLEFYRKRSKWRYKCFACEATGDAIDVLMKRDEMTFRQALDALGMKEPPRVDLWQRKYRWLLVCDACRNERVEVRDMEHLVELGSDQWEIASDGIAAVGPWCLELAARGIRREDVAMVIPGEIIIVFDGDEAGRNASLRMGRMIMDRNRG